MSEVIGDEIQRLLLAEMFVIVRAARAEQMRRSWVLREIVVGRTHNMIPAQSSTIHSKGSGRQCNLSPLPYGRGSAKLIGFSVRSYGFTINVSGGEA